MIAAPVPLASRLKIQFGYSPFFRHIVTSALLAALLLKFSSVMAPGLRIETTSWAVTFLYLYFALARAAFMRTRCIALGRPLDAAALASSSLAFSGAFAQARAGLLLRASV